MRRALLALLAVAATADIDPGDLAAVMTLLGDAAGDFDCLTGDADPCDACGDLLTLACDGSGRVQTLSLSYSSVGAEISPAVADLTELTTLSLVGAGLRGPVPPEVWGLPNLMVLNLDDNELTGSLPASAPASPGLYDLRLHGNAGLGGTIPDWIGEVPVHFLYLGHCDFEGPVSDVVWAGVGSAQPSATTSKGRIDLHNNGRLNGTIGVVDPRLHSLVLTDTGFTGSLPELPAPLEALYLLQLQNVPSLTGTLPASWVSPNLESLLISNTNMGGELPAELAELGSEFQFLELSGSDFEGELPDFEALSVLSVGGNRFTNIPDACTSPEEEICPLFSLSMRSNALANQSFPDWVTDLSATLITLDLQDNPTLSGEVPAELTREAMPALQTVTLHNTSLSCALPADFECFEILSLAFSSVTAPACGEAVAPVVVEQIGGALHVAWEPLPDADAIAYRAAAWPAAAVDSVCDVRTTCETSGGDCWIDGLEPFTDYEVRLAVVYHSIGLGVNWLDPTRADLRANVSAAVTTGDATPAAPELRLLARTASSVTLEWPAFDSYALSGGRNVTSVQVFRGGQAVACTSSPCTVAQLQAATEYAFTASADNGAATSALADAFAVATCSTEDLAVGADCFYCYGNYGCDGSAACAAGFTGALCGECPDGRYRFLNACAECSGAPLMALLALAVAVAAALAVVKMHKRSAMVLQVMVLVFDTMQLVSITLTYTTHYTHPPATVGLIGGLFFFDVGALHPECFVAGGYDWHAAFWGGTVVLPLAVLALAGATILWARRRAKRIARGDALGDIELTAVVDVDAAHAEADELLDLQRLRRRVRQTVVTVAVLYAVPLLELLTSAFECVAAPGGQRLLLADQSIDCAGAAHRVVQLAAGLLLGALALALAALLRKLLRLQRAGMLRDAKVIIVYSCLFEDFKPDFAWFGVALVARKAAMVCVGNLLVAHPYWQAALGAVGGALFLAALVRLRPFQPRLRHFSRGRVGFVDVSHALHVLGAVAVLAFQLFALAVILSGAGDPEQSLGFALPACVFAAFCAAVALTLGAEMRRGFVTPSLSVTGADLERELADAYALMFALARRRQYHYAAEVRESVEVLRSLARDEGLCGGESAGHGRKGRSLAYHRSIADAQQASADSGAAFAAPPPENPARLEAALADGGDLSKIRGPLEGLQAAFSAAEQFLLAQRCVDELAAAEQAVRDALDERVLAGDEAGAAALAASSGLPAADCDALVRRRRWQRVRRRAPAVAVAAALLAVAAAVTASVLLAADGAAAAAADVDEPADTGACFEWYWPGEDACAPITNGLVGLTDVAASETLDEAALLAEDLTTMVAPGLSLIINDQETRDACQVAMEKATCLSLLYPCNASCVVPELRDFSLVCDEMLATCGAVLPIISESITLLESVTALSPQAVLLVEVAAEITSACSRGAGDEMWAPEGEGYSANNTCSV